MSIWKKQASENQCGLRTVYFKDGHHCFERKKNAGVWCYCGDLSPWMKRSLHALLEREIIHTDCIYQIFSIWFFFITVQLKSQSMIWSMARETELGLRDREKMQSTEFVNWQDEESRQESCRNWVWVPWGREQSGEKQKRGKEHDQDHHIRLQRHPSPMKDGPQGVK